MSQGNELGRVNKGIAIAVLSNMAAVGVYGLLLIVWNQIFSNQEPSTLSQLSKTIHNALTLLLWGIGFSQVIHILPIALWFRRRRESETLKGLTIGAAISCLLCGGCFVVFSQFVTYYFLRR